MPSLTVTEHCVKTDRHTSFYLAAGPEDGPLMIFVHGWPEQALSWRHQLPFFAAMGIRAIAPDMRGYGRSSVYAQHDDYRLELIVEDMLELLNSLKRESAIWIGHDWGSPVVWSLASHHPDRCRAVASLCVPYRTIEMGLDGVIDLVDREVYPQDQFPAGQWEYMRFYEENFDKATAPMDANPHNMIKLMFRKGSADGFKQPSATAMVRKTNGWFGGVDEPPDFPRDEDVITEEDLHAYASALKRNGFFGPNSWYMNHEANTQYGASALNNGFLDMPVLFIAGRYDFTCETMTSPLAEPMRKYCRNLSEAVIDSGHWMAQEKPFELNRELVNWVVKEGLADH